MANLEACASVEDYRRLARARLPRILFDYIDGGSYSEQTLRANVTAFQDVKLKQRVMIDVDKVDPTVKLFEQDMAFPVICAPVGFSGMYARRGEVQAARAAHAAGIPICLSTLSICSIEEVTRDSGAPPWFQLYIIRDRSWAVTLMQRAKAAGCKVLVLTADLQTPGTRYRDIRSGMARKLTLPEQVGRVVEGMRKFDWTRDVYLRGRPHRFGNLDGVLPREASFADAWAWIGANFDPSVNWDDLAFIRDHWDGPVVLKGVMCVEDAELAVKHGLDGIVVSNHGGRQLDSGVSTLSVLPDIANAVGDKLTVLMDGGVRSGGDVVKALQSGARGCLVGRAWAFALAAGGEFGVSRMLTTMQSEILAAQRLSAIKHFASN